MTGRIPFGGYDQKTDAEMILASEKFLQSIRTRRTIRDFSDTPVPRQVIENCLLAAGKAPSGANLQPWHFAVVTSAEKKLAIRQAAEKEEREFYQHRATPEWLRDLAPLGTDDQKPFLEMAPYLIAVFVQTHRVHEDGTIGKCYYATESVGIAVGMLLTALHHAGLATLTHTPSPMGFLNSILGRPKNERPFLLIVTGHAATDATVPNIRKKELSEIVSFDA